MGTFSRIRYVIAANMNALLEKAEDPEKLLRALIREMEDAGEDARLAVADLLAEQAHMERQAQRLEKETAEWQERAEQAVAAERDDLARAAIKARAELQDSLDANAADRADLSQRIAQLEADMATLKAKLGEAKAKLKEMHSPKRSAAAPTPKREDRLSRNERRIRNAMGRFDRLQNQVERLEARVRSYEVGGVAPSPWEAEAPADPAVEAELDELKARVFGKGTSNPAPAAKQGTQNPPAKPADSAGDSEEKVAKSAEEA